jgi:hypothetical protein
MNDIAFSRPIILQVPGIGDRKVATSFEATDSLKNRRNGHAAGAGQRGLATLRELRLRRPLPYTRTSATVTRIPATSSLMVPSGETSTDGRARGKR